MGELGLIGLVPRSGSANAPIRADRSASLAGERGGRLDRLDLWFLVVLVARHHDPADVPPGRAVPDALRRGLPRADGDGVPPGLALRPVARHLRVDPPAPRQVRDGAGLVLWGEDDVSATSDLGVPVVASVVEPRRDDPACRGGRAGERLHVATGTEIRTYDLRDAGADLDDPGAGRHRAGDRRSSPSCVVGYDDGRVATLDLDGDRPGRRRGRRGAGRASATVAGPVGPAVRDATTAPASRSARATISMSSTSPTGTVVGRHRTWPGWPASPTGAAARRSWRRRRRPGPVRRGRRCWPTCSTAIATDYEALLAGRRPDGRHGRRRAASDIRDKVEAAIADGRLPGIGGPGPAAHRRRHERGRHVHRPGRPRRRSRRSSLTGGAHGLADMTGVDDPKLYVTSGDADDADLPRHRDRRRQRRRTAPSTSGPTRCRASATRVVYDPASQMVHILGPAPDAVRAGAAGGPWTVYVVEPHGNAVLRRRPAAPTGFDPGRLGRRRRRRLPGDDRQELLVFDASGSMASIDDRLARLRLAAPRRHRRRDDGRLPLPAARILFRRRLVGGPGRRSSCWPTGCSSSSRGSA